MSVWYLDLDDEITDAVARLRAAKDDKVVLVLPLGSRIGTGRINLRLLAREAVTRGLTLALVSGDAQTRALAASAGIAAHATIADAERAMGTGGDGSRSEADGTIVTTPLPGEGARVVRRGPTRRQRATSWGMRGGPTSRNVIRSFMR